MKIFNKNVCRTTINTLILLVFCAGLCLEAAAVEIAIGESYELEGGYSIKPVNVYGEKAHFSLYDEKGGVVAEMAVNVGERVNLNHEKIFHFDAILESISRTDNTVNVHLIEPRWEYNPKASPEPNQESGQNEWLAGLIVIIALVMIGFISIFAVKYLKNRKGTQKTEEYEPKEDLKHEKELAERKRKLEDQRRRLKELEEDGYGEYEEFKELKKLIDEEERKLQNRGTT
ncbi:MAG: hypothetical protein A7316_01730 [Candidatus Altiarchaeales archaeon WOR_SM1_86-2]|nr:MAG: hypothetical protein A7316_01730 [Candidatus Altiarchaeales archaeon WOR_SM1_86-2]